MATISLNAVREPVQECIQQWSEEQERLEGELAESLASLEAFQRQLEHWQRQLAEERSNLESERDDLNQRLAQRQTEEATRIAELEEERARQNELTNAAEIECERLAAELQRVQVSEQELAKTLEEQESLFHKQKTYWTEELGRVHALLERQALKEREATEAAYQATPAPPLSPASKTERTGAMKSNDPVLGSVVAQFDKLRQQRAERSHRDPT